MWKSIAINDDAMITKMIRTAIIKMMKKIFAIMT